MYFVFWQNILSPHQAPFIRALGNLGYDVTVVSSEAMTADRLKLGWKVPDMGSADIVVSPSLVQVRKLIENSPKDAIHVLAGARLVDLGDHVVQLCLASGRRMGIMTEAPDPRGISCCGRWAKYALERFSRGRHYGFVLAMGGMGLKWFRQVGYPARKVFPFLYVTEPNPLRTDVSAASSGDGISFFYAGQFVYRKGLDLFLRAFATIPPNGVHVRLLGDGPEELRLKDLAQALGIHHRVVWLAQTDSAGVQMEMGKADVTLLPSRHDGWGAVVNESLMAGTPVICSDRCGAADLVRDSWRGDVFPSGSVEDLAAMLEKWIARGRRTLQLTQAIKDWSSCISGESAAQYFEAVMNHVYHRGPCPQAPWLE